MRLLDGFQHGLRVFQRLAVHLHLVQLHSVQQQVNGRRVRTGVFKRLFDKRFLSGVRLVRLHLLFVSVELGLYLGRVAARLFQRFHALLVAIAFLRDGGKVFRTLLRLFDLVLQPGHGLPVRRDDLLDLVLLDTEGFEKLPRQCHDTFFLSLGHSIARECLYANSRGVPLPRLGLPIFTCLF